jgi:hypothetical protein
MFLQGFQCLKRRDRRGLDGIRLENGEQTGAFFGQALGAFGQNVSMVNFDFDGQITHGAKLRLPWLARKK